ncbi:suppressor of Ty 6 homolog, partial [Diaphorina citri]|uniref:Suppressor of Ty 6 homolog n=1 Tax=Diaphorina citri TaxID=121845 RepID=A0A3Q0JHQ2_DIACI
NHVNGNLLDGSRVHPETYEWARKMAVDALEDTEDPVEDTNPAGALEEILKEPDKLKELDLDAFAEELERQGFGNKSITLYDIRAELCCRYKDLRAPYQSCNTEQLFDMLTKETPESLYIGKSKFGTGPEITSMEIWRNLVLVQKSRQWKFGEIWYWFRNHVNGNLAKFGTGSEITSMEIWRNLVLVQKSRQWKFGEIWYWFRNHVNGNLAKFGTGSEITSMEIWRNLVLVQKSRQWDITFEIF